MAAIRDFPLEKDGINIYQNIRLKLLMFVQSAIKALNGSTPLQLIWSFIPRRKSSCVRNVAFLLPMHQHLSSTKEITVAN